MFLLVSLVRLVILEEIAFLIDEVFGKRSPLDSVLKIENIMRSCKSNHDSLAWVLVQMADWCLNRVVQPAEMVPFYLFGKGSSKGKLGMK